MTQQPEKEIRRWGRQEPGSKRWWRRYNTLVREGFIHEEAARLAEGRIASPAMREGRKYRREWVRDIKKQFPGILPSARGTDYEALVLDMYEAFDWRYPYSQFYAEPE